MNVRRRLQVVSHSLAFGGSLDFEKNTLFVHKREITYLVRLGIFLQFSPEAIVPSGFLICTQ